MPASVFGTALLISFSSLTTVEGVCTDDLGCSLNGKCGQQGVCQCDVPWLGSSCDLLDVMPTLPNSGYNQTTQNTSSWGGSVVQDFDGTWHMFVSEMAGHCGLKSWKSNSQIVHAVSDGPLGPYVRVGVTIPGFAHNPTLRRMNDTWLLYHIGYGDGKTEPRQDCTGGITPSTEPSTEPGEPHYTMVRSASSLQGPWIAHGETLIIHPDTHPNVSEHWTTNPAPLLAGDEVWYPYRNNAADWPQGGSSERLGMAKGTSAFGPFQDLTPTEPIFPFAIEDPYLWTDVRGHFHMLTHKKDKSVPSPERVGSVGHAYSLDGVAWHISANSPINDTIPLVDGTSVVVKKIARPQMVIRDGIPAFLSLGATALGAGDHTTTIVVPLRGADSTVLI